MDFMELPTAPSSAMFDKIMAAESLRVPFGSSGHGGSGYRPMPLPVFAHNKAVAAFDRGPLPQPGHPELARTYMPAIPGISINAINLQGIISPVPPNENALPFIGDCVAEKSKRTGGGRGSRGGGTTGRKRSRGGTTAEVGLTPNVMEGGFVGGFGAQFPGRTSVFDTVNEQCTYNIADKVDRFNVRKQSGQGNKRGDKKLPQYIPSAVAEPPSPSTSGYPCIGAFGMTRPTNNWTGGVLDIYHLPTRPTNIKYLMVDVPLAELMNESYQAPKIVLKDRQDTEKVAFEDIIDQKVNSVLQLFPDRPQQAGLTDNVGAKVPWQTKVLLDLESPVPPEVEECSKHEATSAGSARCASPQGVTQCKPKSSKFNIDDIPNDPFEEFMTRLSLGPSDSLQTLIAQSQAGSDRHSPVDSRVDVNVLEQCRKIGSIPPMSYSYPPAGPVKVEHRRKSNRVWRVQLPEGPVPAGLCGVGLVEGQTKLAGNRDVLDPTKSSVELRTGARSLEHLVQSDNGLMPPSSFVPSLDSKKECSGKDDVLRLGETAVRSSAEISTPMDVDNRQTADSSVALPVVQREHAVIGKDTEKLQNERECWGEVARLADVSAEPQVLDMCNRQNKQAVVHQREQPEGTGLVESCNDDSTATCENKSLSVPPVNLTLTCQSAKEESCLDGPAVPLSPSVTTAANILVWIRNPEQQAEQVEPQKPQREKDRRRRFQSYLGAPTQKATKSMRLSQSNSKAVGKDVKSLTGDGGSVPPSKALVSERRKSLSQIDASEKPSLTVSRNGAGAVLANSRGALQSRLSNVSAKVDKCSLKDSTKDAVGRGVAAQSGSSPGLPSSRGGPKGAKANGHAASSIAKGSSAAPNITKLTGSNTRLTSGGSRSTRPVQSNNTHGTPAAASKSSRQGVVDARQKSKADGSARGVKAVRD